MLFSLGFIVFIRLLHCLSVLFVGIYVDLVIVGGFGFCFCVDCLGFFT